jgi:hypothetical protein
VTANPLSEPHFAAGLSDYVDLREGDLRQMLAQIDGSVDFVLMGIWEWRGPLSNSLPPSCGLARWWWPTIRRLGIRRPWGWACAADAQWVDTSRVSLLQRRLSCF